MFMTFLAMVERYTRSVRFEDSLKLYPPIAGLIISD